MMPMPKFEVGHEKIPGSGMRKGQKATKKVLRANFLNFTLDNFEEFKAAWNKIKDPKDKCDIFIKAAKVNLPPPTDDDDESRPTSMMDIMKKLSKFRNKTITEEEE